jgi:Beta protein
MELKFGYQHYVPVLRCKPAEIGALAKLTKETKSGITPLLEFCPEIFDPKENAKYEKSVSTKPEDIISEKVMALKGAIGRQSLFIDLLHLPVTLNCSNNRNIWDAIREQGLNFKLKAIPVTGFFGKGKSHQTKIAEVVEAFGFGVAFRIFNSDLERRSLTADLDELLKLQKVNIAQTDMIVDLQIVGESSDSIGKIVRKIPRIQEWRSLTVLAGSFPIDLSKYDANDIYILPRHEWKSWQNELHISNRPSDFRMPAFGDYTIQHPKYKKPIGSPRVSASIRYTTANDWIVFRGEWLGKKNGSGSAQYPAEAKLLMEREEFCEEDFSYGDKFIADKARNRLKPGNPPQWLLAGINHHMTLTGQMIQGGAIKKTSTAISVPQLNLYN